MAKPNSEENLLNEIDVTTEIFHVQKYIKNNQEEHLKAFLTMATTEQSVPKLTRCDTYCGPKLDCSLPMPSELKSPVNRPHETQVGKIKK